MDHLAPAGAVYQAGTLSGNPLATAAGLAVLEHLDDAAYGSSRGRAEMLAAGLEEVLTKAGIPVQLPRVGPLFGLFFSETAVRNYDEAKAADAARYARFFHGMLDRGHYFAPSAYEAIFVSLAHTPEDLDRTLEAAVEVAPTLVP